MAQTFFWEVKKTVTFDRQNLMISFLSSSEHFLPNLKNDL